MLFYLKVEKKTSLGFKIKIDKGVANFSIEKRLWKDGKRFVVGIDEVGRGCLAGPITVGIVCFPKGKEYPVNVLIDDSKKLSPSQRIKAFLWIKENALFWDYYHISPFYIDKRGVSNATSKAIRSVVNKALKRGKKIDFILLDAFFVPYLRGFPAGRKGKGGKDFFLLRGSKQMAIINGDEKSLSIAAASIVAKVMRDSYMVRLSKRKIYKVYGWGKNKGYGTKEHLRAIKTYGITKYHRKLFLRNIL